VGDDGGGTAHIGGHVVHVAAGLMEMPPVSNVMPLPTSATFFALPVFASLRARLILRTAVGQPDQPGRARRTLADADHAAVAVLGQRLVIEHLDLEARRLTQSVCALGEFGRITGDWVGC